jgi:hypothetical protein
MNQKRQLLNIYSTFPSLSGSSWSASMIKNDEVGVPCLKWTYSRGKVCGWLGSSPRLLYLFTSLLVNFSVSSFNLSSCPQAFIIKAIEMINPSTLHGSALLVGSFSMSKTRRKIVR